MSSRHLRFVFLVALGHLVIELCSQYLPVIYPILRDTMALSYTQVGVLALVASLGTSVAQPLFGYLCDRWDPRWLSVLSIAWIGVLMGLVGWAQSYVALAAVIGLGVLGSAAFHPPGATIASAHAGENRGASVSVFSVGGSVGSALSPLLVTAGMAWFGSTRGTVVLTPVALLFAAMLFLQLRRMEPLRRMEAHEQQEARDGNSVIGLVLVVLAVMCLAWFHGSFRTYLPMWIESQGRTVAAGGRVLFVLLLAMGVGSLAGGALSDRVGRWQLLAVSLGLLGPVQWLFVGSAGPAQWVLIGVMGVLLGATFPVSIVMAQETWPSGVGIASGLVMGLGWLPGGLGASVTGMIADRVSLEVGLRTLVVPAILGTACVLAYGATRRKSPGKQEEPVLA